jgi:hypothetical protein
VERQEILVALGALGNRLAERGLQGDLYLVGGAALALAYDARRTTRDVDAVFEPKMAIYEAAADVAEELGLPPGWLNDGVKGFLVAEDSYEGPVIELPGLRIQAASPQMLLALKVIAHRINEDRDDVRFLAQRLGLETADQVLDLVQGVIGRVQLTPQAQFFVEAVMDPEDG